MKAFTKFLAVAIASVGVLSVAGCAKSTPNYKTATSANWNARTSTSVEKGFSERWLNNKEVAEYSISFTKGANTTYSVNYNTDPESAEYSTAFYMKEYDWSALKSNTLLEGYAPEENVKELVYVYETSLEISGEYVHTASGDKKQFNDVVKTVCYYRLAGDNLQPVYSEQEIKSTAPNTISADNIQTAVVEVNSVYKTYYNYSCTAAKVFHTNLKNATDAIGTGISEASVTDKIGYSVFDNCQLRAAVRAFTLSGGSTYTFNVFVPQNKALQTCTATCTAPVMLNKEDEEQQKIITALENAPEDYIFFDNTVAEDEEEKNYRFNAVSMAISADMGGSVPTLWYSTVENSDVNSTKCVLLRMTTPISFGLGTLNYALKSLSIEKLEK